MTDSKEVVDVSVGPSGGQRRLESTRTEDTVPKYGTSWVTIQVIATAMLGGVLYGFSANAIAGTLAQTSFIAQFLSTSDAVARTDGLLAGFLAGALVGSVGQAPLSNKFGRKPCNAAASVIVLISAALQAGSVNIGMLLFSRTFCGLGAGMAFANTPVYMSEVSPPHTRGLLVGMTGTGVVIAYIGCAFCSLVFSFVESDIQWRLVFIVLTGVALVHLGSLYFLPESPRWLMSNGKEEQARAVLNYLHRTTEDPTASLAHAEAIQIKAQIESEKNLPRGYIYIFRTPHLRKRAFCSILLWVMGQGTGITAIANLIPVLMGSLGFGPTLQLSLGLVWTICAVIGCGINCLILDRVGRVKLLVIGGWGCAALLGIMAALDRYYLNTTKKPGVNAAVALYFIFGAFFTSTIECTAYVYAAEIWPTQYRSEGSSISFFSFFANAIAYSAPVAVALQNIGYQFFLILLAVTAASTIGIMFTFPETKGLPLEEINRKFGAPVELDLYTALAAEKEKGSDHQRSTAP